MNTLKKNKRLFFLIIGILYAGIQAKTQAQQSVAELLPKTFGNSTDSTNSAGIKWKDFFSDKDLVALIDTALKNNLDLSTTLQDIEIAKSDVRFKKGLLFPSLEVGVGSGIEKVGRYTSQGAGDASADITSGKGVPENLSDFSLGLQTAWEVDVWGKLRNAKKAAFSKYLSSIQGRNFVTTNLVAEVANTYYELLALNNELKCIKEMIELQKNALIIVQVQKEASRVTELAVKQFQAQLFNSQSMEFDIHRQIIESENKLNFLLSRYPQPIACNDSSFLAQLPTVVKTGIPSQLLKNRPDIKQKELELYAAKCDVKAARAEFYPSFSIKGGLGFNAFKTSYLFLSPESMIYSLVGDLTAPLINRSAIQAEFNKAKAYQVEAMYDYEKTILTGYIEVANEISNINNLQQTYDQKKNAVDALASSINISDDLFKSGKADYLEVLMVQHEALASKLELMEVKKQQFNSMINMYKALGGGWK